MRKKLFIIIGVAIILALSLITLIACDTAYGDGEVVTDEGITDDGFNYQIINEEFVKLGRYEGDLEEVIVPAQIKGKPVKSLSIQVTHTEDNGEEYEFTVCAFSFNKNIKKVVLPNGLSTIEDTAFLKCKSLEEVVLPDTIESIGKSAFSGCNLKTINFPSSLKSIGDSAFNKNGLETIDLPDGLESIGDSAFMWSESVEEIIIPDSVTHLGAGVFGASINLTSATIGNGLNIIPKSTFYACVNLESVEFNSSIVEIDNSAFSFCQKLSNITLPENLQKIGNSAFSGCELLSDITLPQGVTQIGNSAFSDTNLSSIEFPEGLVTLGEDAFSGCESLERVVLNDGLRKIPARAFEGCVSLTDISIHENIAIGNDAFKDTPIPAQSEFVIVNNILIGVNIDDTDITIPEGVTKIVCSFDDNNSIENIYFPASLEDYGSVLDNLENLDNIYIDENNSNFTAIDSVIFSKNMEILYYFPVQKGWTTYTIPEGVKVTDMKCSFKGLKEIIFPQSFCFTREEVDQIEGYENIFDHESLQKFEYFSQVTSSPTFIFFMIIDFSNELDFEIIKFKGSEPDEIEEEEWYQRFSQSITIIWDYEE